MLKFEVNVWVPWLHVRASEIWWMNVCYIHCYLDDGGMYIYIAIVTQKLNGKKIALCQRTKITKVLCSNWVELHQICSMIDLMDGEISITWNVSFEWKMIMMFVLLNSHLMSNNCLSYDDESWCLLVDILKGVKGSVACAFIIRWGLMMLEHVGFCYSLAAMWR